MQKKIIGDFHLHSTGSDGKLSPEEVAKLAIKLKLPYICFTDHYFYPPKIFKNSKQFFLEEYQELMKKVEEKWQKFFSEQHVKEVEQAKEKFKNQIEIYFGVEFNWVPDFIDWTEQETKKRNYDFILGSVHIIPIKGKYFPVNWTEEIFIDAIQYAEGVKNLIKEYHKQIRLMVMSELFDCVAHFDLIKVWNKDSKYFSEQEDWYKKEVLKSLDKIAKYNLSIEINTSNWRTFYPCDEQCPSLWILKEARKREIPITIGSDSHEKEHIEIGLERAVKLAKQAGYNLILKYKNRKPIEVLI